ncbi:hypothetical protein N2152v2_008060 [Parachlorella kessleri]
MHATTVLLALLSAVLSAAAQGADGSVYAVPSAPAKVGVWSQNSAPFYSMQANGSDTGFEVALRQSLCQSAKLDCKVVLLPNLADRLTALTNGSVDFVVGSFSVTPDRMKEIDFVQPYYYSAGAALYAPDATHAQLAQGGWQGLRGKPVCVLEGYYALDAIKSTYGANVIPIANNDEGISKVKAGQCVGIINDSTQSAFTRQVPSTKLDGWEGISQVAGLPPILTQPYGVAVAKGNAGLAMRLASALVDDMKEGPNSPILQWEKEYVVGAGFPPNPQLNATVNAISSFE